MKSLVTGGTGFVGSFLVERLLKEGHKVTVFDNMSFGKNIVNAAKYVNGDISDVEKVKSLVGEHDVVFHLAGVLGTHELMDMVIEAEKVNVIGTLAVLEGCRKFGTKMICASKPNPLDWINPYTITKLSTELYCRMYHKEFGVDVVVLRLFNLYGPRQKSFPVKKIVPNFMENALLNKPIPVFGDGTQPVEMVYVEDAVEACVKAIHAKEATGQILDMCNKSPITVNELVNIIIKMTESKSTIQYLPMRRGEPVGGGSYIDVIKSANAEVTKKILCIRFTPLEEGLKKTIQFYRESLSKKGFFKQAV
ncbi:MAG: NAD-dependent epimerase/dehydratase family protein [Nitrososphaerales archaeon]|nr:NAD-dependent epimerase/dehydratase family protein [Nitrososphaerales archaeon]